MRLGEDVIRYMTVKQEGRLPTPRPSTKSSTQQENEDNAETKESQPVKTSEASTSEKDNTETKENPES